MVDSADLRKYLGCKVEHEDLITATQVQRMNATLDREEPLPKIGDPVPAGWHLIFFPKFPPTRSLSPDGTEPAIENGMPDPLPVRMFAASRAKFHHPLRIGDEARRISEITSINVKEGRSGQLVFVTFRQSIHTPAGLAIEDEREMVFLEEARNGSRIPPPGQAAPEGGVWHRTIHPTNTMLFRFSALTFNAHRIHYDTPYATGPEGYPGLLVHGPLTATWLLELARDNNPGARITGFDMRARAPLFAGRAFRLMGRPRDGGSACDLWAITPEDTIAMEASATLEVSSD